MDSVDEIMLALAEKYAVEKNERWSLAREGSAIGKAVIFWLNAVHRAFYEHVERSIWTARYERLKDGKPLRLRIPNITPELTASFDCRGTTRARCHRQSAARRSEALTHPRTRDTCSSGCPASRSPEILQLL